MPRPRDIAAHRNDICFEDLTRATEILSEPFPITKKEIIAFARRYDPQPFHVDEKAARLSLFGGLISSGWMTAALTIRLLMTASPIIAGGGVGLGLETLLWKKPVRPRDTIRVRATMMKKRRSKSRPSFGIVKLRIQTLNQHNEEVQLMISNVLIRRHAPRA